jgi:hypothetical protein
MIIHRNIRYFDAKNIFGIMIELITTKKAR